MLKRQIASLFLRATGWRVPAPGEGAQVRRCIVLAAPHTSNWDMPNMVAFAWIYGVRLRFMMKHTMFVGPAGWLFRRLGGIAIERHRRDGVVKQAADLFTDQDELVLVIAPEGTRGRTETWKSGFYHIARRAEVPVWLSYLDYGRREGGFGPAFDLTGDVGADMDAIRDFYADKTGRHPELFGEIRLPEEGPAASTLR